MSILFISLLDINECNDTKNNACEQGCVNTRGSFKCFCKRGFTIDPKDPSECLGKYT